MSEESPNQPHTIGFRAWPVLGLVIALAVIAGLVVKNMLGGGRVASDEAPPAVQAQDPAEELADLGDRFGQVMENQADAGPLLEQLDRFVDKHPDQAPAHTLRGQMLMYVGRHNDALQSFDRSLDLDPDQAGIHRLAGTLAMKLNLFEQAKHHYERALRLEPGNGSHAVFLANALHKLGDEDEAVAVLREALRRDSQLHTAYALLSDIYAERGELDQAMQQVQRALDTAPPNKPGVVAVYTLKRASLFRRQGKPAESLALLNALPAEARLRADLMRDSAESWAMLDKPALAAELYERVLSVDPTNDHAAAEAARWWLESGDIDAARRNLQLLRRINPRHEAITELDQALRTRATNDPNQ